MFRKPYLLVLLSMLVLLISASGATAQRTTTIGHVGTLASVGTAFTYQGRLADGGRSANGTYDFEFELYDTASSGTQVGSTVTKDDVTLTDGLFTVELDFGGVFDGTALWLNIGVRPGSSTGAYTALTPRQSLTPVPYALALPGLWTQQNTTSPNVIGGYSGNSVPAGVVGATIGGGGQSGSINQATANFATVGGGAGNTASGENATISGGYTNTITSMAGTIGGGWANTASGESATVGGGYANTAGGDDSTVGGGNASTASGESATVGGGLNNTASGQFYTTVSGGVSNTASGDNATIGGGGNNTASGPSASVGGGGDNTASGDSATVAGGGNNTASGERATVGGGLNNTASGDYDSTVGGGNSNVASGWSATVSGGYTNTVSGAAATIGGGEANTASGQYATVPGGQYSTAAGSSSFAAGSYARANHDGSFVWGDSNAVGINSPADNTFIVRANGGIWFGQVTSSFTPTIGSGVFISTSTGAYLTTGGAWTNASDAARKENFAPVDGREVLGQLVNVPVGTWNYRAEDADIRHLGPTAQDFYAAFGLGNSDKAISTVDADGVALAAIQGMYQVVQEQEAQIAAQQGQIADLEARVAALEATVGRSGAASRTPIPWLLFGGLVVVGLVAGAGGRWKAGGQR